MLRSIITICWLVTLLTSELTCAKKSDAAKKQALQMEKFMKDLYSANNLNDLEKYGGKETPKPASKFRSSAILGRGSYNDAPASMTDSNIINATPGKCDPKPVCISNPLTLDINSTQTTFPPCIMIHRCDGCCHTNEMCVAIGTEQIKMQNVHILTLDVEINRIAYDHITTVDVTNHTDCQCQCKWQNDIDCRVDNKNMVKDPSSCACICPEEMHCDAYHQFDRESCTCKCKSSVYGRLEKNCMFNNFDWNDETCRCQVKRY